MLIVTSFTNVRYLKGVKYMTNFEKIKNSMTVEFMTVMLYLADDLIPEQWCSAYEKDGDIICNKNNCRECIKNWLESEADE